MAFFAALYASMSVELMAADLGIAKDYQSDFEALTEVRAEATYGGLAAGQTDVPLSITWANKKLKVTGTANAKAAIVVDTWKDNGDL